MPLDEKGAIAQARIMHGFHLAERSQLDVIRRYWKGRQKLPAVIPVSAPHNVKVMSRSSRVNVIPIVLNSLVQATFVDGFRAGDDADDLEVWEVWQANRMDARQTAIHRAAFAYGASYAVVLPGDPVPVIRGASPRNMTCLYGEDQDWPMWAFEKLGRGLWRLYDDEAVYYLAEPKSKPGDFEFVEARTHGAPVTPVVRFLDEDDLDADDEVANEAPVRDLQDAPTRGQVAPLMPIQDQIDLTTFGLQVAQHYGAFRQRYILGWVAENEKELMKASAANVWTFPDASDGEGNEIKIGEFAQTNLDGYIKSREASLRHAALLSQTPIHEMAPDLANPSSAEALAAIEKGHERKVDERHTNLGESHEQMFWLAGQYTGTDIPEDAQVVWRDTSARAFAATVDALGKLTQMLGIPPQELWERVPGTTRQDVDRWKAAAETGDSFQALADMLERQATNPAPPTA